MKGTIYVMLCYKRCKNILEGFRDVEMWVLWIHERVIHV